MANASKVLILTLPPDILGGVATKAKIMADFLRDAGCDVTIAFYATRLHRPELCTWTMKSWFGARPKVRSETAFGGHRCIAVGCLDPFLEYNYSRPSKLWRKLIEEHDIHFAIGGTSVIAGPLSDAGVRHLIWCASDVEGDRSDRRRMMPLWRRVFDRYVVTPGLLQQQQSVLKGCGRVLGVSPYTVKTLARVSGQHQNDFGVLPIPTDIDFFHPPDAPPTSPVMGFAGRLDDPRKNPSLLFEVLASVRSSGIDARLRVTGEKTSLLQRMAEDKGVGDQVEFSGVLNRDDLRAFYQGLRVLVIPSFQEGLAIVGIEAMACGVPVISTRCGGPEAYIRHRENGYLIGFDPAEAARRAANLFEDDRIRDDLSASARETAVEFYAMDRFERRVREEWSNQWREIL